MRRIGRFILAVAALLGVVLIAASFAQRNGKAVLLHWHGADDTHDFLVADRGTLILARQQLQALTPSAHADASEFGKMQLTFASQAAGVSAGVMTISIDMYPGNRRHGFQWTSFGPVVLGNGSMRVNCHAAAAPTWAVGAALLIPSLLACANLLGRRSRRSRRLRRGLCARCGYDLRGSGERCPECGQRRGDNIATSAATPTAP